MPGYHSIGWALLIACMSGPVSATRAQSFIPGTDVQVYDSAGSPLPDPWTGGFNFCQFSPMDLDGSPPADMLVFDRSGNRVLPFLRTSTAPGDSAWRYAPEFRGAFPEMQNIVLARDWDGDGDHDLFTYADLGLRAWRNQLSETGTLAFAPYDGGAVLTSDYGSGPETLAVPGADIPALVDVDGDGDLDLLTFDAGGDFVEWHANRSMDWHGVPDSLIFELADACWAGFQESPLDNALTLGVSCLWSPAASQASRGAHLGSTLAAIDMTGDGALEVVVGDISFPNLTMLGNGGSPGADWMTTQNSSWPISAPVDLDFFPAAYFLDTDADGDRDLVVAPNGRNFSENQSGQLLYDNTGDDSLPDYQLTQTGWLQNSTIDAGEGAFPALFDANADGLPDLVLGNHGTYEGPGDRRSSLLLMLQLPGGGFQIANRDWASLSAAGLGPHAAPAFADLDGDGDGDMLIGDEDGQLHLFTNIAAVGAPAEWQLTGPVYQGIDVGSNATPFLADLNRDGRVDLVVGERNGTLNYFENTGTASSPDFQLQSDFFGGVDVSSAISSFIGFSTPFLYDNQGEWQLLVGGIDGHIRHYVNLEGNLDGTFMLKDSMIGNIDEGERVAPLFGDLDGDGLDDLVIGNYSGGLSWYNGELGTATPFPPDPEPVLVLAPNPAGATTRVMGWTPGMTNTYQVECIDALGRSRKLAIRADGTIEVSGLPAGMHTLIVPVGERVRHLRLLRMR